MVHDGMGRRLNSGRGRAALVALTTAAAGLLAASALGAPPAATVAAKDDFFEPAKVKIGAGEKVQWTNEGSNDHTVKLKGKPDKIIAPGESTSIKFKKTGKFKYQCTIHAGMDGKVIAGDV